MLRVKQKGIKYHFLSLSYDSTSDWTSVSRAIGKHSTHWGNRVHFLGMKMWEPKENRATQSVIRNVYFEIPNYGTGF